MSIVRIGLGETEGFSDGYEAIFGKKKKDEPKKAECGAEKKDEPKTEEATVCQVKNR